MPNAVRSVAAAERVSRVNVCRIGDTLISLSKSRDLVGSSIHIWQENWSNGYSNRSVELWHWENVLLVDESIHHLYEGSNKFIEDISLLLLGDWKLNKLCPDWGKILLTNEICWLLPNNWIGQVMHKFECDDIREEYHSDGADNSCESQVVV